jgi:hypothetical protein
MKTKIGKFKPSLENLMLMDAVLSRSIRSGFKTRNQSDFGLVRKWRRDDIRDTIKAYRMIKQTEVCHVD